MKAQVLEICASFLHWPIWWRRLSFAEKVIPAALIGVWWFTLYPLGGLGIDQLRVGILLLVLGYLGSAGRSLLRFLLPFALVLIIYDSLRLYGDALRGTIHIEDLYQLEKKFFGVSTPQGTLTLNEWWQLHLHPVLDVLTGIAYLIFFSLYILISAYFRFYRSRTGTRKVSAQEIRRLAPQMGWAFFWVNLLGYSTYYWYPAAPPWYVAKFGLGPPDLSALPDPAGCARFDQIFGVNLFSNMYQRSADVFGAIPSLHVSYPLLAVLFSFRFGALREFSLGFYVWMCFSAIYLNHHYVIDVLWGSAYAVLCFVLVTHFSLRKRENEAKFDFRQHQR